MHRPTPPVQGWLMGYRPFTHRRRSIRLPGYDYSQAGAYFVTVCTRNRECLFVDVGDAEIRLNECGRIIAGCWQDIPLHFADARLDAFLTMPNHLHGIIVIGDGDVGAMHFSKVRKMHRPYERPRGTVPASLGAIVQNFKSVSTRKINAARDTPGATIWQRNYYEHIIRNEREWSMIAQYIRDNPAKWSADLDNPLNPAKCAPRKTGHDYWRDAGLL